MSSTKVEQSEATADVVVSRQVTLARGAMHNHVLLQICRPIPTVGNRDFQCRVLISTKTRRFERLAYGVDSLQAMKLAIKAADIKIRLLAESEKAEPHFLGPGMPPVFDELESVGRLGKSLVNCLDALELARAMLDPKASVRRRQRAARQISRVLESSGVIDTGGRHIRTRRDADRPSEWKQTALRLPTRSRRTSSRTRSKRRESR